MTTSEIPGDNSSHNRRASEGTVKKRRVLVICASYLKSDPRVLREIHWLTEAKDFEVFTVGFGPKPSETVVEHFQMGPEPAWLRFRVVKALVFSLVHGLQRFRWNDYQQIPERVRTLVAQDFFDVLVFNDLELLPWIEMNSLSMSSGKKPYVHVDLHEWHNEALPQGTSWPRLFQKYWSWLRSLVPSPRIDSRTVVASGISEMYVQEFHVDPPQVVRNAPDFEAREPRPCTDGAKIRLVYHGAAAAERGLFDVIDAVEALGEKFSLRLMLTGAQEVIDEVDRRISLTRATVERVSAVGVSEIAAAIADCDLEVMFYRPTDKNLEYALPNKLFEAVQARLGLVIGESPSMVDVVQTYGNGAIVSGWDVRDLINTLDSLTPAMVSEMKSASDLCAREINSQTEGQTFLAVLSAGA